MTTNHHDEAAKASLTCVYPIIYVEARRMYECDVDAAVFGSFVLSDVVRFEGNVVRKMQAERDAYLAEIEANRDPSQPRYN